ncbi:MAG TPA: methyltransferase domain-containing protein [Gammaproteobacteria bacterium]|nr:methyltransferase domain-containing protein [Gammaproteobacteria bacterium]
MSEQYSEVVKTAQEYYNSEDADNFYFTIWGGEDLHIGLYESEDESIRDASVRTVARMASKPTNLNQDAYVLDLGAGYGGSARYLAKNFGCRVVAENLSEVENERDRQMNKEQGLDHLVEVVDGSFDSVPYEDGTFDVIWSQDAFLHSDDRAKVMAEAARLLKSGGQMVFTDPMQADDCPEGVLQPILDRIHLDTLGSPGFYQDQARSLGLEVVEFEDHTPQLTRHYGRVLQELDSREDELEGVVSREYIERMKKGLGHWIEGGKNGYLAWGIFHFRKP